MEQGFQMNRRMFLGSLASAFAAVKFNAVAEATGRVPRLKFGVVSDIHVSRLSKKAETYAYGNSTTFHDALAYFRDRGVDAVVCAGDMSDRGTTGMLDICGKVWQSVFPNNTAPDGRRVEPIFIYGNHDSDPQWFDRSSGLLKNKTPEEAAALSAASISRNEAAAWKNAFGEAWAPVYLKKVKGYPFIGVHWGHERELAAFLDRHRAELAGTRPFFEVQHPHPKGTLYGHYTWGEDRGLSTAALAKFPNAVSFSGHSHTTLALEASVWQGAFTAIGASSLSYQTLFKRMRHCVNVGKAAPYEPASSRHREGMLVTVYDDCLVIERREFVKNVVLGPDWVIPLPFNPATPRYSVAAEQARLAAPAFPAASKLDVRMMNGMLEISHPAALYGDDRSRTVWYDLDVTDAVTGRVIHQKAMVVNDFFAPIAQIPPPQAFRIDPKACGAEKLRFEVRARDLFDRTSEPLVNLFACKGV